ncbi:MAG: hypothetical protein IKW58_00715 [Alphaproteobacteria bacterium]|nr:hypothetical protein [Alphaproteobacteria bacterium]
MRKFILYIGIFIFIFNVNCALGIEDNLQNIDNIKETVKSEYIIRDLGDKPVEKKERLVIANNKFYELLILPYLIDKLYPDDKIEEDISPFLQAVYPDTDVKKLEYIGDVLKVFVISKRQYQKIIGKLKHNLKAKEYTPKDTPEVAYDGSYIGENEDFEKTSSEGEYKISYNPYKYIEYDKGELGEPVRRRDKNYEPSPEVDELTIALLEFDIKGVVKALKKMPKFNDGSAEKPFIGDKDLRARILVDTATLKDKDKFNGVIQIRVPDGYYINGDFMNNRAIIKFILSENGDVNHNISQYQFYQPLAYGVQKDGIAKRVFVDYVSFPFSIKRTDLNKDVVISGDLFFELCNIEGECEEYKTQHSLTVKQGVTDKDSIYYNHVTQAHAHIPQEKSKNAELNNVYYDTKNQVLNVIIDTKRKFSNVAVMVEDDKQTNFLNPRYQIKEDKIIASFDVKKSENNDLMIDKIAISASFNDLFNFRKIVEPTFNPKFDVLDDKTLKTNLIFWGIGANFLFGVLYIFIKMISFICSRDDRWIICGRYFLFSLIGSLFALGIRKEFSSFVSEVIFCSIGVIWGGSILMSLLGYMKFELFRPFKNILKHGAVLGFFTPIIISSVVFVGFDFWDLILSNNNLSSELLDILAFLSGVVMLPIILGLGLYKLGLRKSFELRVFNTLWTSVYLGLNAWFLCSSLNLWGGVSFALAVCGAAFIWYRYPFWIEKNIKEDIVSPNSLIKLKKIELKVFGILCILFMLSLSISLLGIDKSNDNPSLDEINIVIEEKIKNNNAVLVAVMNKWSFLNLINRKELWEEENNGLTIAYIETAIDDKDGRYWLDRFNKKVEPLFVLFSNRHKQGLVLPSDLRSISFRKAIKDF